MLINQNSSIKHLSNKANFSNKAQDGQSGSKAWKINVPELGNREIYTKKHQVELAFALITHKVKI